MYNVAHFLTIQADQAPEASAVKLDWERSGWRPARSIHKSFLELDLQLQRLRIVWKHAGLVEAWY